MSVKCLCLCCSDVGEYSCFPFSLQTQRPEQSVMQALESLNDVQVRLCFCLFCLSVFRCDSLESSG